jgi:coenzyme PQQ precursor peptide PqqA
LPFAQSRLRVLAVDAEQWINGDTDAFALDSMKGDDMTWETPTIEDIACGMEVTAYAPSSEGDDLHAVPAVAASTDADS